jgi:8-hydroxy-5-deazaflavin:NADPH oxidoreductase
MKKISVLGSGVVGQTLADGFLKHGYAVMRGSRDVQKLADWPAGRANAHVGTFVESAAFGEIVVLAVKGGAAVELVTSLGSALDGKVIIDATNPILEQPPKDGMLAFFTSLDDSLMEQLVKAAPKAHFVKAFSSVGNANFVNPDFGGTRPSMFICGNDAAAKATVTGILDQFGWETEDMGVAAAARVIEPLCILWCIPGMLRGQWTHAFKVLKR